MSTQGRAAATPKTIKASEFKAKCLQLMDEVAETGEEIVITKHGRPVSRLAPYRERPKTLFGRAGQSWTTATSAALSTWSGKPSRACWTASSAPARHKRLGVVLAR